MNYSFPEKLLNDEAIGFTADGAFSFPGTHKIYFTVRDGDWEDPLVWGCTNRDNPYPNGRHHSVLIRHKITKNAGTVDVYNVTIRYPKNDCRIAGILRVYGVLDTPYAWDLFSTELQIYGSAKDGLICFSGNVRVFSQEITDIRGTIVGSFSLQNTTHSLQVSGVININGNMTCYADTYISNANIYSSSNLVSSVLSTVGNGNVIATNCKIKIGTIQGVIDFIDCGRVEVVSSSIITGVASSDDNSVLYANIADAPSTFRCFRLDYDGVCGIKILIASGRTLLLSYWYPASGSNIKVLGKQINGEDSASTLIVSGIALSGYTSVDGQAFHFQFPECPMETGQMTCDEKSDIWYDRDGDQQVKGATYNNLTLGGSGSKKLMGDVTVTNSYTLSGTATVDLNGFTLTTP